MLQWFRARTARWQAVYVVREPNALASVGPCFPDRDPNALACGSRSKTVETSGSRPEASVVGARPLNRRSS